MNNVKISKEHIREEWNEGHPDDGGDGYWIALMPGWKSMADPVGNLHTIHEATRRDALAVGVMRCECKDCKQSAVSKEPWQMTQAEWIEKIQSERANEIFQLQALQKRSQPKQRRLDMLQRLQKSTQSIAEGHQFQVQQALLAGKPVPPEVLADYPEFPAAQIESKREQNA